MMANPTATTTTRITNITTTTTKTTTRTSTRKRPRRNKGMTEELPVEIQIEILRRLPIESITACLKVCKSWNSLIRQPFFAKLHQTYVSPVLTITCVAGDLDLTTFTNFTTGKGDDISSSSAISLKFTARVRAADLLFRIVGSCNGLICLFSSGLLYAKKGNKGPYSIVVCNPASSSYFVLPDSPDLDMYVELHDVFGFGYIPSTGQYKVVKLNIGFSTQPQPECHIYTIQNGMPLIEYIPSTGKYKKKRKKKNKPPSAWRTVHGQKLTSSLRDSRNSPAFFKGSIIWLVEPKWGEGRPALVYFDVEKEEIQTLLLPWTIYNSDNDWFIHNTQRWSNTPGAIGVYYDDDGHGHLYLLEDMEDYANIWVMEDYKCTDSLKLKWVIPRPYRAYEPVKLFKVQNNGKLLIALEETKLAYYDSKTGNLEIKEHFCRGQALAVDHDCLQERLATISLFNKP